MRRASNRLSHYRAGDATTGGRVMTPDLMILIASLTTKKKRKGRKWCKRKGIGAIRREIGSFREGCPVRNYRCEGGRLF